MNSMQLVNDTGLGQAAIYLPRSSSSHCSTNSGIISDQESSSGSVSDGLKKTAKRKRIRSPSPSLRKSPGTQGIGSSDNIQFKEDANGRVFAKLVIPRMVHTGVHLTYAGLLAHVYNSCDYDLMYQFLNSYYRPDFVLHQELTGNFPNMVKGRVEVRGRNLAGKYWYERMHDSPDVVFAIRKVDIKMNEDESDGVITCYFGLTGTHMLPAVEPELNTAVVIQDQGESTLYVIQDDIGKPTAQKQISLKRGDDFDDLLNSGNSTDFGFESQLEHTLQDDGFLEDPESATLSEPAPRVSGKAASGRGPTGKGTVATTRPSSLPTVSHVDILRKRDDFVGLEVPEIKGEPLVKIHPFAGPKPHVIHYSYQGMLTLHFDADSLIYFSDFVLHNN